MAAISLDKRDRQLVGIFLILVFLLILLVAVFTPRTRDDNNPMPGSNLTSKHGAKAAYTLLQSSGYRITRWQQPLVTLADQADDHTVLILAQPALQQMEDEHAVRTILEKGGRVLVTGLLGGQLLPGISLTKPLIGSPLCQTTPVGISPLATSGKIWMLPEAEWRFDGPGTRPQVAAAWECDGGAVVTEYPWSKGHVVWWANSTPLENGNIARDQNLELLLASVGPPARDGRPQQIFWDESLHGLAVSRWDFTSGPIWPLAQWGALGIAVLTVLSYSRRSGPIRPLPEPPRTTPVEFADALGGLYKAAGANSIAVAIAWDRFRTVAAHLAGLRTIPTDPEELAQGLVRRFGSLAEPMAPVLAQAAVESSTDDLKPRRALVLVQQLHDLEETLHQASRRLQSNPHPKP
jgi:Domain of unknown function (DUF4350)